MDGPRAATSLAAMVLEPTLSPKSSRSCSSLARFCDEWNPAPGGVEARDVALEWPEPLGESSDLESAERIPGTNRVLLAESGDDGSRFKRIFLAEVSGDDVEIADSVEWPTAIENVEGMAV